MEAESVGREKGDCRQDKERDKNEVRERAERKPRRSHQQVERENRDDKSLFPLLSVAAQETSEHGQQCDSRVSYPTSSRDILFLVRLRCLHGISHQPRHTVLSEPLPLLRDVFIIERLYDCR